jgi:hypothetical protein
MGSVAALTVFRGLLSPVTSGATDPPPDEHPASNTINAAIKIRRYVMEFWVQIILFNAGLG